MTLQESLRAILEWSYNLPHFHSLTQPRVDGAAAMDPAAFVGDVSRTLRRDMKMRSMVYGLSFVLMGLVVPTEVTGVLEERAGRAVITFHAATAAPCPLSMCVEIKGRLDQRMVDMLYALAPCLAAYMRAHDVTDILGSRLGRASHVPKVPPALLDAAALVPFNAAPEAPTVAEALVKARLALQDTGYHVPSLDAVRLADCSLEAWLGVHSAALRRAAALEETMLAKVAALKRTLDGEIHDILELLHENRRALLLSMAG